MAVAGERWITDWPVCERFSLYTRANAGEVMPDPASPLAWTLVWEPALLPGWLDAVLGIGFVTREELPRDDVVGSFGSYLYINASVVRLFGVRGPGLTPEAIDHIYFGEHPDVPPYVPEPWHESEAATARIGAWIGAVMSAEDLPELRVERDTAAVARANRPDLTTLSDEQLVARARSFLPLLRELFCRHIDITAGASIGPGVLAGVAEALNDPSMPMRLVSSVGDVDSAAPSQAMWEISRVVRASAALTKIFDDVAASGAGFDAIIEGVRASDDPKVATARKAFADLIEQYGSRGPNEWDIRSEVWETKPALVVALIDRMRHQGDDEAPFVRNAMRAADRTALTEHVEAALAAQPDVLAQFQAGLRSSHVYLAGRERSKTTIIRVLHEVRMAVRELGSRYGYSLSGITMLLADEMDAFLTDPSEFRARLASREQQYLELYDLDPPFIINKVVPPLSQWARRSASTASAAVLGDVLTGVPGCPGVATGRARVILDPADPSALDPGDVLIAPITDPAWTPLFVPAAAVIVDVGAQVSHAVIVSRELGIPCVVSVTDATRRIPDGALVRVDGGTGTVTIVELA
jgi:rifampicin phosphotransferase